MPRPLKLGGSILTINGQEQPLTSRLAYDMQEAGLIVLDGSDSQHYFYTPAPGVRPGTINNYILCNPDY